LFAQNGSKSSARPAGWYLSLLFWLLASGFWLLTSPTSAGLTGTYFAYNNFAGERITQVDRVMDLQWSGKAPPAPGMRADAFSVRWDGELQVDRGGMYEFAIQTDGSFARLWIDGRLVISGWRNVKRAEFSGSVQLTGGQQHSIRIDYNDSLGPSYLRLLWTPPGGTKQIVPESALRSLASPRHAIRINFGPANTQAMDDYVLDSGAVFGDRGDGLRFGWDAQVSSSMVEKPSPSAPDARYSTFVPLADHTWEIEVPSGMYRVRVVAGAPDSVDAVCNIDVEDRPVLRNKTLAANHWLDGTARVVVTDGRLTMRAAQGASNATLCFAEITPADDSERLLSWMQIGYSSDNTTERCMPASIHRGGWRQYVKDNVVPELQAGSRRFLLSNPFGTLPTEQSGVMQLDQLLHAKADGLDWVDRDFVQTWKPICDSGVEVIAYFGAANEDPDFKKLEDPKTNNQAWFDRFFASIKPALDCGMSIGLDGASQMPENSLVYQAVCKLRAMNVTVYVEPRPCIQYPWPKSFPVISVENFWHMSNPAENTGAIPWAVKNNEMTDDVIRFVQTPPPGKDWKNRDWFPGTLRQIIREGHTAAINFTALSRDGVDPWGLLIASSASTTQPSSTKP
jgi:hypothetical protein